MPICQAATTELVNLFGTEEATLAVKLSLAQERVENTWSRAANLLVGMLLREFMDSIEKNGTPKWIKLDEIDDFLMRHRRAVTEAGINSTAQPNRIARLAKGDDARKKSLKALREWWDRYRKGGKVSKWEKENAETLKKLFLDKIFKTWKKHANDYLGGDDATKDQIYEAIRKEAKVVASRARMITETETTRYFNKGRREVYDQSPDVTHYLFMAIRDHRTTKWCRTRHGLVYPKDAKITDTETPPCHWNCRSEMLPLLASNPVHRALIDDPRRQRSLHHPEPLPRGWNGSA